MNRNWADSEPELEDDPGNIFERLNDERSDNES